MSTIAEDRQARSERRLSRAARQAPVAAIDAAAETLASLSKHHERTEFVTWMLHELAAHDVGDLEGLVTVLERPEVLADLRRRDALAPARLRGLRARKALLEAEGGVASGAELARAIGITRQAVDKRRLNNTLIGIDLGKRGYGYPVWQVGLDGLADVLTELDEFEPWTQALFMLSANSLLEGETPLARLRRGEVEDVVNAARHFGEQTAS